MTSKKNGSNGFFDALKKFGETLGTVINEQLPKIKKDVGRLVNAVTENNNQTTYQKIEKVASIVWKYGTSKGGEILKETYKRNSVQDDS